MDADQDDEEENFILKAQWRKYTIFTWRQKIQKALNDEKSITVNESWKKFGIKIVCADENFTPTEI